MDVAHLLAATATCDAPRIFERSIKLQHGAMSEDRGLVSFDKRDLYPGPWSNVTEVCGALGCHDLSVLKPYFATATAVHFGVDGDIGKCYLEFQAGDAPAQNLVFLALKWRGEEAVLNRYTSVSHVPHAQKKALVAQLVSDDALVETLHACLDLAKDGDPDDEAVTLHVTEDGSQRASIDISVADARHTIGDVQPVLEPLFTAFDLPFTPFVKAHANKRFGHIAAGNDKAGQGFATLYFGAQPI